MADIRQVKPGDWIKVGSIDCVVSNVRDFDVIATNVQVVCNPENPVAYEARREAGNWAFSHPMHGKVAKLIPNLAPFIAILKRGPGGG